ncbi:MAG TPA: Ig-like domain-containing domain [Puia sp.]|nr:Ig-like domain-containing domain [Puia sp.]
MKFIRNLTCLLIPAFLFINIIGSSGCANIIPPMGGPKDTLPPKLVNVSPHDSVVNFHNKTIVFNFDEFIEIDNPQQNVLISPTPKINPFMERHLRTLTVRLKDTLLENTTYFFDFGKTIKDVNEGNVLKNFNYVFSTGPYLDSLNFSGNVIVAETGKTDSTLIVMLHTNLDDSAVIKDRPRYVTHVDTAGRFTFRFVAPGTYNLYALKDEGGSKRYLSKTSLFAFNNKPVQIGAINVPVTLYAFTEKREEKKPTAKTSTSGKKEEKEKRLVVGTNLQSDKLDLLGNLELQFQEKLKNYDSSKIHFKDGSFNNITSYHLTKDTTDKKLTLVTKWVPDSAYHLILEKDFAQDSSGRKLLKADTISFRTMKESDYGEVKFRFRNLDLSKNPVLEFVQSDAVKFAFPLSTQQFNKKLFTPGDYDLRILYDDNKNGIWDAGEFFGKHQQPEKAVPVIIPMRNKKRVLTIKANWENDFDFAL